MARFPVDAPKNRVIRAMERLGFQVNRARNHIVMVRGNSDGLPNRLVMPNHRRIKGSTLRRICTQSGISRAEFLDAYREVG